MKCPVCGGAELVADCRDVTRQVNGITTTVPNVQGDYCPACGSRLFHRRDTYGAEINIKAGSLDDTSWFKPAGHIWTGSKQKWVTLPAGELTYEGQPSDYDAMKRRWREMTS